MRALIQELAGYGLMSAAAFALDLSLLTLLVNFAGWQYLLAATTSFIAGGVLLYALSVGRVFRVRRLDNRALELSYFVGLGVIGLAINLAVMYVAVDGLRIPAVSAKFGAAACTLGANFLLRRQFLFSRSR